MRLEPTPEEYRVPLTILVPSGLKHTESIESVCPLPHEAVDCPSTGIK
jgi:hypothetical protein